MRTQFVSQVNILNRLEDLKENMVATWQGVESRQGGQGRLEALLKSLTFGPVHSLSSIEHGFMKLYMMNMESRFAG